MMSKDPNVQKLIHQMFDAKDYFAVRDRMIGSGSIGRQGLRHALSAQDCRGVPAGVP